jgi:hypothetical protein
VSACHPSWRRLGARISCRKKEIDWQIRVENSATPLPCKLLITAKITMSANVLSKHAVATCLRGLMLATLLCVVAGCAEMPGESRPAVVAPAYRVGDRWVYQVVDGFRAPSRWVETHEVIGLGLDGITVRITQQGERIDNVRTEQWPAPGLVRTGSVYNNETREFATPLQRYVFPLAPGQVWNQWVENVNDTAKTHGAINRYVVVGGWQKVTTPAGVFDAIQLRVVMRLDDGEFWRWPTTCNDRVWYAPEVRAFVRADRDAGYVERGGPDPSPIWTQHAVFELSSYRPGV